jgi:CDP-paratose 2-epimerase
LTSNGVSELFSTAAPISLYGATKLASEALALEYGAAFDLPVFINRCGVLAGAGQFGKIDQGIFSYWIHSYARRRPLKYIGFNGNGHQVRDCLHARDLLPLVVAQMQLPRRDVPRILNVSGGIDQSASLRELSLWCASRFGEHPVASDNAVRPFDVPWLVLDAGEALRAWNWRPQTSLEAIWSEIAEHARANPDWLDMTVDA